jgi:hypothetical protein
MLLCYPGLQAYKIERGLCAVQYGLPLNPLKGTLSKLLNIFVCIDQIGWLSTNPYQPSGSFRGSGGTLHNSF